MHTCDDCSHRGLYSRYVVYSRRVTRCYISPFCKRSRVSAFTPFRFLIAMPWATPRGKSDGGGVGVLGGGGRTKSWAPVAIASAHPAERALYMYRFPPAPSAERRRIFCCTVYRDSHLRRPRERQRSSLPLLLPSPSAPACGPRFEKFRHTAAPDAPGLCSRLHHHRPYCRMNSCTQMAHRVVPQCPVGPGTFPSLPTSPFLANFRMADDPRT